MVFKNNTPCYSIMSLFIGILFLILGSYLESTWLLYTGAFLLVPALLYGFRGKQLKHLRAKQYAIKNPRPERQW